MARVQSAGGLLGSMSQGHRSLGLTRGQHDGQQGVWYREWAPAAKALFLTGDFNGWSRTECPLVRDSCGVWSVFLPDAMFGDRLVHGSRLMVHVHSVTGPMDRIPSYARRVVQDEKTAHFTGQYWHPAEPYRLRAERPKVQASLRIYEAHVGMSGEEPRVSTFAEFTEKVLERIARAGYNAVQLMAVAEHPYYGSFGYHVSNFYAVSSRFGTPDDLRMLIDRAHELGLIVLLDLIHSHCVKNIHEGLNHFDGTEYQYFHAGARGQHVAWDSLCFDYGKIEVLRFLLSNIRYWLEEYGFDGFRFDGVTSMCYIDHGLGRGFNSYDDYFSSNVDRDAVAYLQMANLLAHTVLPGCVTIAEDVSGMIGMARPVPEGGLGFDYRLAMGIPDYWVKLLKERRDEDWNLLETYHCLLNRRHGERHVAYCESHDQALVGDKTIAFWLMDQEMYWSMARDKPSHVIDRGIALHKLIRLISFSLGGEAWLNFMGNEFGHPEWIDFPREGNGYSFAYARRQWSLVDNPALRYVDMGRFDAAMLELDARYNLLADHLIEQLAVHEEAKQLVYRRGPLVFVFNFHPTQSYSDLRIPVPDPADYEIVLNSDDAPFGGFARVAAGQVYPVQKVPMYGRGQSIQLYLPNRSAQVLAPIVRG